MENEAELRKAQENLFNVIEFGAHKEIAKWHKALFDAYINVGFNQEQALKLVISWTTNQLGPR